MKNKQNDAVSNVINTALSKIPGISLKLDEPLRNYTSFKIGGPVRVMFFPENIQCMVELCDIISEFDKTPFVMGNGSNILASDSEHDIIVINTSKLDRIERTGQFELTAEAGALLSKIALFANENGLSGLEFAHGIPGTLGGAVVMNAGAYDGEMSDVVCSSVVYCSNIGLCTLTASDHEFAYRHSRLLSSDYIVLSSILRLTEGVKTVIKSRMDELAVRRRESQPLEFPSGGSTFKRPGEGYAAALIEQAGLKGYTVGGAQVSKKHAGFVINRGDAEFADVMAVIEHVREVVYKNFGVELELELKIIL